MSDFEDLEGWDDDLDEDNEDSVVVDPDAEFLGGRVLIAMPGIEDPRFEQALILICAHGPEHAMGITLNRPLDGVTLPDLLERLGVKTNIELPPQLVLSGGPVERERGFVLHSEDFNAPESTMAVTEGVGLTATRDVLQAMADAGSRPERSTLALGYAAWGPGQLEREIRENVWLTCDPDVQLVFDDDHETKWNRALAKLGVTAGALSGQSGRA